MIENAVEQDFEPATMRGANEVVEIRIVAEPRVDPEMIDRVVAMARRVEDRPEGQTRRAKLDGIVEPGEQVAEPVAHRGTVAGSRLGTDKAERVDLPPDLML